MANAKPWMIYGANGYTGKLIAQEAVKRGLKPILAGRTQESIQPLADSLGLPWKVFSLEMDQVLKALEGIQLVLHCAGPFSQTSEPMIRGCLVTQTHYLDITGEIAVLENAFRQAVEAEKQGISILPGVGFDVVPTDCLAKLLKDHLPDAVELDLAIAANASLSQGTLKSMIESIPYGSRVRRNGKIEAIPLGGLHREIPFQKGTKYCSSIGWGDVSTAFYTTGIPNITVYAASSKTASQLFEKTAPFHSLLGNPLPQKVLKTLVTQFVKGPSEAHRLSGKTEIWGEVRNSAGKKVQGRLEICEGYHFTVLSSLAITQKLLDSGCRPGTWTPAQAFGPQLIDELGFHAEIVTP